MPAKSHLIGAYRLHWERKEVDWHPGVGRTWQLLGRRGSKAPGLRICDFRFAAGVYVLEKAGKPVYAGLGRSGQGIGARLLAHQDDGTKNWTRFSWFSFDDVWLEEARKTKEPYPKGWATVDPRDILGRTEMRQIVGELEALLVNLIFDGRLVSNIQRPKFDVAKEWQQVTAINFRAPGSSSTQFRNVAGFRSNNDPTCRRAPTLESPPSARRSRYIRTARSTNSRSYFFGAPMRKVSLARSTPSGRLRTVHTRVRISGPVAGAG